MTHVYLSTNNQYKTRLKHTDEISRILLLQVYL